MKTTNQGNGKNQKPLKNKIKYENPCQQKTGTKKQRNIEAKIEKRPENQKDRLPRRQTKNNRNQNTKKRHKNKKNKVT